MANIATTCAELLAAGAGLAYGLVYLGFALAYCLTQRDFWLGETGESRAHLKRSSRDLWSLSDGSASLLHEFIRLKNGKQLHYLIPKQQLSTDAKFLVVFLHGFPDSAHLFARQLNGELAKTARMVALDLPGCGGSDSLEVYGPNDVLNIVAQAIIELKKKYLSSDSSARCMLVGHDWGGVIGFRVAAETIGLVDEVVTLNSLYPAYAEEQLKDRVNGATASLARWQLGQATNALSPVLSQLRKSSYTYMLTLPLPISRMMPRVAFCLLRYAHKMEYGSIKSHSLDVVAAQLAKAYGPSSVESAPASPETSGYTASVLARARTSPPGDLDQRVRLYSDGLLRDAWSESWSEAMATNGDTSAPEISTRTSAATAPQHVPATSGGPVPFKCPVTIIFGLKDVALDPRIVLDGIEKYFVADAEETPAATPQSTSRVIRLPKCGHWSIIEEDGAKTLEEVLRTFVSRA